MFKNPLRAQDLWTQCTLQAKCDAIEGALHDTAVKCRQASKALKVADCVHEVNAKALIQERRTVMASGMQVARSWK